MYSLINLVMCFPCSWSLITLFMLHVGWFPFLIIRNNTLYNPGFVHLNYNYLLVNVFLQPNLNACLWMTLLYFIKINTQKRANCQFPDKYILLKAAINHLR